MPDACARAEELYLVSCSAGRGPARARRGTAASRLPSGYQPQCNPCFHPGSAVHLRLPRSRDHPVPPGTGTTALPLRSKGPWKLIVLVYNPTVVLNPFFTPVKSQAEVDAGEAAAGMFLPLFGGSNPFELETGTC